jgi:hypothetical protein
LQPIEAIFLFYYCFIELTVAEIDFIKVIFFNLISEKIRRSLTILRPCDADYNDISLK